MPRSSKTELDKRVLEILTQTYQFRRSYGEVAGHKVGKIVDRILRLAYSEPIACYRLMGCFDPRRSTLLKDAICGENQSNSIKNRGRASSKASVAANGDADAKSPRRTFCSSANGWAI